MQANTEPTQTFKRMLKKHARESAAFQEKVCTLMEKGERLGGSASKHAESVRNWLQRQDLREVS